MFALPCAPLWCGLLPRTTPRRKRPTLTLTPAVVLAKIKPGQGWTQTLRMSNTTGGAFNFEIEVQDVVVKDGHRTYVPAGETDFSIASTAVATPRTLTILPQQQGTISVTLTVPERTPLRAVVVYFKGRLDTPAEDGSVGLGASLGALITFGLSEDYTFEATGFSVVPQSQSTNPVVSHELLNSGTEVVVPKGTAAIIDGAGKRVAKATFESHRILPGERVIFSATCPLQLKPGHYRAISSFEFATRIVTASGDFSVP